MLTGFYVAFATVCFTLLGLWIIVVQTPPCRVAPEPGPQQGTGPRRGDVNASRYGDDITAGFLSACVLAGGAAGIDRVLYIQWSTPR
jgi:hypothetical protein